MAGSSITTPLFPITYISLKSRNEINKGVNHSGGGSCGLKRKGKYSGNEEDMRVWDQKPLLHSLGQDFSFWDQTELRSNQPCHQWGCVALAS